MTTYGMISTYPPTRCRLANFAGALRKGLLDDHADEVRVVRVGEPPHQGDPPEVVARLGDGGADTESAAAALNECDVALIQHDFEIYGGADGQDILAVVDRLTVPTIAVLHTVPAVPTAHQREVLEELMDETDAITVMSDADADRLVSDYAVDAARIAVIPASVSVSGEPTAPAVDAAEVSAGYGRLASLLRAEQAQLLV